MSKHVMLLCGAIFAAGLLVGCATQHTPVKPTNFALVHTYRAPLTTNFHDTPAAAPKEGSATTYYLYEPLLTRISVCWDDCAVAQACKNGKITKIYYADYRYINVLGIFAMLTTYVHGE